VSKHPQPFTEIRNKKAFHEFFVEETFEAGIVLLGTEVKAIREGRAQIKEAFVRFEKNRPYLFNAYIEEYSFGNVNNHDPKRSRALLLKKREIQKLRAAMEVGGRAVLPIKLYLKSGLLKLEIAICKGKKLFDKREALKTKDALKEAQRALFRRT